MLNRKPIQLGPVELVTARLPPETASYLRAYAVSNNRTISGILGELVAQWVTVHKPVHSDQGPAASRPGATPAIPSRASERANTGKSEPIAVLQRIDADRAKGGTVTRD